MASLTCTIIFLSAFELHHPFLYFFFFFNDTATTEIYTLSYTTLFRSRCRSRRHSQRWSITRATLCALSIYQQRLRAHSRSEEHTSELQSPCNLVCRLLLEKKKEADPVISRTLVAGRHKDRCSPDSR